MFELAASPMQLGLAVFDDEGRAVCLGVAKSDVAMLSSLDDGMQCRFLVAEPTTDSKKRGDEVRQLAWSLWTTRSPYLWLIAPGDRRAFACRYDPLELTPLTRLPHAADLGLGHEPPAAVTPRMLASRSARASR